MLTENKTRAWVAAETTDDLEFETSLGISDEMADHFEGWHGWHIEPRY